MMGGSTLTPSGHCSSWQATHGPFLAVRCAAGDQRIRPCALCVRQAAEAGLAPAPGWRLLSFNFAIR